MYVPTNMVDVQLVMNQLRVRFEKIEDKDTFEDDYVAETTVSASNGEILCYDLSKSGYIGVPRTFAIEKLGITKFINLTTYKKPLPHLFVRKIKPRDQKQKDFMDTICSLVRGPKPVDIVANARTGTGKTVTALYVVENGIQNATLVAVPTNYLLNQWRKRIIAMMGQEWFDRYVGHIQQDKTDYEGRLIVLAVAKSLAVRDYPLALRQYFTAGIFDEWHTISTPSQQGILGKYFFSVRIGFTATNRRDALLKVSQLHLGKPRVQSQQVVEEPTVFVVPYSRHMGRQPIFSEGHAINVISRLRDRNILLANIVLDGYQRGRQIVMLSDRVEQLQRMIAYLRECGVAHDDVGLLVGSYTDERGKKVKMKQAEQDRVSDTCAIIGATYGVFSTGADVDRLDMGVELTPRQNLRQAVGRVLRILPGKPIPEWYSIDDEILVASELAQATTLFAPPQTHEPYAPFVRYAKARLASYADQKGTVVYINAEDFTGS